MTDSWEKLEKEDLYERIQELKEGKKKKEKLQRRLWKTCQLCGFESKTYNQAETHFMTDHSQRYGNCFIEFLSAYIKSVQKIRSELDQKADKIIEEDLKKELLHRALIEPQKTVDQLSKFTLEIARSEAQEIRGELEKGYCRACGQTAPFVKKTTEEFCEGEIEDADYTVLDHWNTMESLGDENLGSENHRKLREYYRKMEILSKGKNPYKESEQLSKDTPIAKDTDTHLVPRVTESSELHKEDLSKEEKLEKAVKKLDPLILLFPEELAEKLKEKKKNKLARKTR